MANGWLEVPLREVAKPIIRAVPVEAGTSYRTLGVKWWGMGAYERETIDGSRTAAKTLSIVREGDLIINKIWVRHGSVAIAAKDVDGCAGSGEFPTFELDLTRIDPRWIHWQTKMKSFWEKCDTLSRGTSGKNRIKPELFLTIKIPLPSLEEQHRIVAHIEALAARITEARSLRNEISADLDAFVSSYHVNYSAGRTVHLGDILFLDEEREPIKPDGIYPQVGVKGFGKGLFARETLGGTQTTYKWFNHLYYGAIVLSQVKGWEGAIGVCDESLAGKFVSPEYRTFRCIPDQAIPEYLSVVFSTPYFYSKLKDLSRGVGGRRERIRPELFIELEIPMPDIQRQKKAVEIFSKFPTLRMAQDESARELEALMPSLLDKAFKGEL